MAITGIGGLFFRARDPKALADWYNTHFAIDAGGIWQQQAGPTVFAPFSAQTDYFAADRQWMINFRVDQLDPLLDSLRAAGIAVTTDPSWNTPETGRFARIHDPEGNAIELWEPPAD